MDAFENFVDSSVAMLIGLPTFDDAGVVSKDNDMWVCSRGACNGKDEEFESHSFCLGDVLLDCSDLPVWEEAPCLLALEYTLREVKDRGGRMG